MIDENDILRLREIFVTRQECETRTDENQRNIAELKSDVRECRTKLNMLIGILAAIAVPVLGIAVKILFGGTP